MYFDKFTQKLFPSKWANKVSRWFNNAVGDGFVTVVSPDNPSPENPPRFGLNLVVLAQSLVEAGFAALQGNVYEAGANATQKLANAQALAAEAPKADAVVDDIVRTGNTSQQIADAAVARIGTSAVAAREDHVHPSPLRSVANSNMSATQLAALAGHAPKAATVQKSDETDAQKIARMGTSTMAAREDHVHPIPRDTATATEFTSGTDVAHPSAVVTADQTTWDRDSATAGFKLKVYTRLRGSGAAVYSLYRELTFDKYGALVHVGEEQFGQYMTMGY